MMIAEDRMQEEIDKATVALMKTDIIQTYATMLRIKHSDDMEQELDKELNLLEIKMKYMDIDCSLLKNNFSSQNES